jgi:hypothetical protein
VTDSVLGEPDTVLRFLADAVQRLGGELRPTGKVGVQTLIPGELGARLNDQTGLDFPLRVTLDARLDPEAEPVAARIRWSPPWPTRC